MFPLGVAHLRKIGLSSLASSTFIVPLLQACERFSIDTPPRLAAFLAQCQVESTGFNVLEENLRYTTPARIALIFGIPLPKAQTLAGNPSALANVVYAGKNGNGDEASGDGWRYHGRGPIQTTCLGNYALAATGVGRPYVLQPELLLQPEDGCLASAFFWSSNGLNALADIGDDDSINAITRRVNGKKMLLADLRLSCTKKALAVLTTTVT